MRSVKIMALALLCVAIISCTKVLDLKPKNGRIDGDAVKTITDLKELLNSAYDALRSDDFYGGSLWITQELLADNLSESNVNGSMLAVYNRNTSLFNQECKRIWNTGYTVIYRSNLVLKYVETVGGLNPSEKANIRGQALFLRACARFELVRLFAQPYGYTQNNSHPGIPLRLVAEKSLVGRSTVGDVYEQILTDLNIAVQELPGDVNSGYANVWAAKALLAKVYFQSNNFILANKNAKAVLNNGPYVLMNDIRKRFTYSGNTENIFELKSTGTSLPGQESGKRLKEYFRNTNGGLSFLKGALGYYNRLLVDSTDQRFKYWVKFIGNSSGGYNINITKLNYYDYFNIPVFHLAEMKLIIAESSAELGQLTDALNELNEVRRRVGLASYSSLFQNEIIQEARNQRQIEMFLEGTRINDLRRIAIRGDKSLKIRGSAWDCPGMVLAIPDDEISANPDILQNTPGGCN